MQGSLLQSLGLQPILDMREREAMAVGDAYRQKYAREEEERIRKQQIEENKRDRRAGLFTTILTGAATIIAGNPAIGKGLLGLFNKNKTQPSQFPSRPSGNNQFSLYPRLSNNQYNSRYIPTNSSQNLRNFTDPNNPNGSMFPWHHLKKYKTKGY